MLLRALMVMLAFGTGTALAVDPAVPDLFTGEWRATIIDAAGDYARWYRPGDESDVAISRLGILRTLDGGGGQIHFLLESRPDRDGSPRVVADRTLAGIAAPEHVEIMVDGDRLLVVVDLPEHGRMTLELARIPPTGIT